MGLLRLEISQPSDRPGSAVDCIERGFNRFCRQNGAAEAKRVWVGDLRKWYGANPVLRPGSSRISLLFLATDLCDLAGFQLQTAVLLHSRG
jgi:hypothetical protein